MNNDQLSLFDVLLTLIRYRLRILVFWLLFAAVGGLSMLLLGIVGSSPVEPDTSRVSMEQRINLLPVPEEISRLTGYSLQDGVARLLRSPALIGEAVRAAAELADSGMQFPQSEAEFYGYIANSFIPAFFSHRMDPLSAEVRLRYTGPDETFAVHFLQQVEVRLAEQLQRQQYELLTGARQRIAAFEAALAAHLGGIDDGLVIHRGPSVPVRYTPPKNGLPLTAIAMLLIIGALAASLTATAVLHIVQTIRTDADLRRRLQEAWRAGKKRRLS